jgi:hypothetical protein
LHSDFWYNSLDSTCTSHYLLEGTNVFQSVSPSKLNFQFIGGPTILHWKGHNSSIWSAIEVNEHLIESLFDKISNRSGPTSISCQQGLQIIMILYHYFCRELHRRHVLVIHPWYPGPSGRRPKEMENSPRKPLDILLLGNLLRRPARASKPSRRPNPTRV